MRTIRRALATLAATATAVAVVAVGTDTAAAIGRDGAVRGVSGAPNHKISNSTSTNWSGYAVTGGTYRSVTASWMQPAVTCSGTAYSSFWVGIDGDTSGTVEQTGTEADCNGSTPVYSSWYEMYPKFPFNYPDVVAPGDHFTSSVTTDGKGSFTLTLSNTTKGWTESVAKRLRSARLASAEVIAEAPSSSGGVLPLANFGTASFSGAKVNGSTLTSSTAGIDAITMQSGSTVKAQPSSISSGAFSVTWKHS
jgi:Peptidase A4 family